MSTVNTSTLKVGDYFHFEGWPDDLYFMTDVLDEGFSCDRVDPPEGSCTGYRLLKHTQVVVDAHAATEPTTEPVEPDKRPTNLVPCVLGECRVGETVWGSSGNAYEVHYVGPDVVVLGNTRGEMSVGARNGLFSREPKRVWVKVTDDVTLEPGDRVLPGTEPAVVVLTEGQQVVARWAERRDCWGKPAADYPLTILNRAQISKEVLS